MQLLHGPILANNSSDFLKCLSESTNTVGEEYLFITPAIALFLHGEIRYPAHFELFSVKMLDSYSG